MLSGATLSAAAMAGTAVLRIVVSSDSMKNATATNHGTKRKLEALRVAGGVPEDGSTTMIGSDEFT
jgi:xanthine/uracil permease